MSEETLNTEAVQPEVAQAEAEVKEVAQEAEKPEVKEEKTFTQAELDEIVQKRLARDRRKWEREQQQNIQPQEKTAPGLSRDQFSSDEEYIDAVAEAKIAHKESVRRNMEVIAKFSEKEEEAIERYGDYDQVVRNNAALPITIAMADVIMESEIGPDIAYFLGTNPKEAARISRLPEKLQAKEIGKIEAKLENAPVPVKKVSNAPEPINPVKPKAEPKEYDLDDPRAIKELGTTEWIRRDRERQIKKLQSK